MYQKSGGVVSRVLHIRVNPPLKQRTRWTSICYLTWVRQEVLGTMKSQRDADVIRHIYHLQLPLAEPRENYVFKNNLRVL